MVAHRRAALSCSRRSPRGRTSDLGAPREPRVHRCTGGAENERAQRSALSILSLCYRARLGLRAFVGSVDLVCPGPTAPGTLPLAQRLRLPPGPTTAAVPWRWQYYLRVDPKERAPGDQHRITPNAHPTAPWPIGLGWGVSGDNLSATFMPRLCVYGR